MDKTGGFHHTLVSDPFEVLKGDICKGEPDCYQSGSSYFSGTTKTFPFVLFPGINTIIDPSGQVCTEPEIPIRLPQRQAEKQ